MRISRGALLRGILGIAISVFAIWVLIRSVDLAAAWSVLRTASPAWIAVMLVTTTVDIGARGARWRALLAPIAPLPYRRGLGGTENRHPPAKKLAAPAGAGSPRPAPRGGGGGGRAAR